MATHLGISILACLMDLDIPLENIPGSLNGVIFGNARLTPTRAQRLGELTSVGAEFWLKLQRECDVSRKNEIRVIEKRAGKKVYKSGYVRGYVDASKNRRPRHKINDIKKATARVNKKRNRKEEE